MQASHSTFPSLILNSNVEITPVREFAAAVRERLGGAESDFILSERRSRASSQRIDAETASFLKLFYEPRRIVDAVIAYSMAYGAEPAQVLNEVYPLIVLFRSSGILVNATDGQRSAGARFGPDDIVDSLHISRCVHALADTELYRVFTGAGTEAALKYVRATAPQYVREALKREYGILRRLEGRTGGHTPRVYEAKFAEGDTYIVMEWCGGKTAVDVSRNMTHTLPDRGKFVLRLLDAYLRLHDAGVLHGDVHPLNVLFGDDGKAKLIDFGAARVLSAKDAQARMGLIPFYEPEVAEAVLKGREAPEVTEAGEQYTVAIVAYLVITGSMYLLLSLESDVALRQIATQPPRAFAEANISWPSVEQVLRHALKKDPRARYQTFREFAGSLAVAITDPKSERDCVNIIPPQATSRSVSPDAGARLFERTVSTFIERYAVTSELTRNGLTEGPTASIYHGAAGIAYALLRLACIKESSEILSAADVWATWAINTQSNLNAFDNEAIGLTPGLTIGTQALFHSSTGLQVVNALIRHASGDGDGSKESIQNFIDSACRYATSNARRLGSDAFARDVTNGAASLLLGAALLAPLCDSGLRFGKKIRSCAAALMREVNDEMLLTPAVGERSFLGFAHGRAGAIYALLRWIECVGDTPHPDVERYLDELATFSVHHADGLAWPLEHGVRDSPSWTGWCHGSAGHVLLWTTAARVYARDHYQFLASSAGRHIWDARGGSGPSLCCGHAGEALALFQLGRSTGDEEWLEKGRVLARESVESAESLSNCHSLFRGSVGISLVAAETLDPIASSWPICQSPL